MKTICFVGDRTSTFVKNDFDFLSTKADLLHLLPPKNIGGWLFYCIKAVSYVIRSDLSFAWFAGWHSAIVVFFSRIFGRTSIVVIGGYDAAYAPEIGYGAWTNRKERWPADFVIRNADLVLPVSKFTKRETLVKSDPRNIEVIENGIDTDWFHPYSEDISQNIVITVGRINDETIKRKGLECFIRAARELPDVTFLVIGTCETNIPLMMAPENVVFKGFVDDEELRQIYWRAKVVCQLSFYESFGLAPAEAAACGCTPVLSHDRIGLTSILGDRCIKTRYNHHLDVARKIREALTRTLEERLEVAEYVRKRIPEQGGCGRRLDKAWRRPRLLHCAGSWLNFELEDGPSPAQIEEADEKLRCALKFTRAALTFFEANRKHMDAYVEWTEGSAEAAFWSSHDQLETMGRKLHTELNAYLVGVRI